MIIHHATLSTSCMALEWGLNFIGSNVILWHPTSFRVQGLEMYRLIPATLLCLTHEASLFSSILSWFLLTLLLSFGVLTNNVS